MHERFDLSDDELAQDRADGHGDAVDAYLADRAHAERQHALAASLVSDAAEYLAEHAEREGLDLAAMRTHLDELAHADERRRSRQRKRLGQLLRDEEAAGIELASQSRDKRLSKGRRAELDAQIATADDRIAELREFKRRLKMTPAEHRSLVNRESLHGPAAYIDGEDVAQRAQDFLTRFIVYPDEHGAAVDTLWTMMTHEFAAFDMMPLRIINSAEPGSGKTMRGDLIGALAKRFVATASISPASVYREIDAAEVTPVFGLDEYDAYFVNGRSESEATEGMRAIINASCYPNGGVLRTERDSENNFTARRMSVHAPMILMGIGDVPGTLYSRGLTDTMRRKLPSEHVERYRSREQADTIASIRAELSAWMSANIGAIVGRLGQGLPDMIENRDAEKWEGIIAIAETLGGAWPEKARAAAIADVTGANRPVSLSNRLLGDIRKAFAGRDKVASSELLAELNSMDDAPWGEWKGAGLNARVVVSMLKDYGIPRPHTVRLAGHLGTVHGWDRRDFADAWSRYLTPEEIALPILEGDTK